MKERCKKNTNEAPTVELVTRKSDSKCGPDCFPPDCDPAHCNPPTCWPPFCWPHCSPPPDCHPDDECWPERISNPDCSPKTDITCVP